MASLDSLPGDQRAVLQLVLGRGRSYEEIAGLLSINPVAVRERALAALDALGPQTKVDPEQRAMIADYLLGQLSGGDADAARDGLSESASQRAWARVLSSELAPLSNHPLPEIPVGADARGPEPSSDAAPAAPLPVPESAATGAPASGASTASGAMTGSGAPTGPAPDGPEGPSSPERPPRSSRLGGAILIGVAVVIVAVVLVVVLGSGGSKHKVASTPTSASTPAASASSTTTASSSTTPKVVSQVNLTPTTAGSKAAGIAEVLDEGSAYGIAIVAQDVPPNTTHPPNAYAVWLYNSPTDAHFLGFVNPGVASSGRLSTAGGLPSNASRYQRLVITVETSATPKAPGPIIMEGTLTGVR
jgi:anti-sigma-K factor RskA